MSALFIRIIVAVLAVILLGAIIPLFCEVIGLALSGAAVTVIRLCLVGFAVFYVLNR